MGKLVRDRIPEIIQEDGKTPIIRIVDEEEYVRELDRKLCEEVEEYRADGSIEEMADVLEVLQAICIARGLYPAAVGRSTQEKSCRTWWLQKAYLLGR